MKLCFEVSWPCFSNRVVGGGLRRPVCSIQKHAMVWGKSVTDTGYVSSSGQFDSYAWWRKSHFDPPFMLLNFDWQVTLCHPV